MNLFLRELQSSINSGREERRERGEGGEEGGEGGKEKGRGGGRNGKGEKERGKGEGQRRGAKEWEERRQEMRLLSGNIF